MEAAGQGKQTGDFPVPKGVGWLEINLKDDDYPSPVFESSLVTKIPFVIGSKPTIDPLPARGAKEPDANSRVDGQSEGADVPPDLILQH
jgi:hypothetical protein